MSNLSPRALALYQAHGPGPVDWERMVRMVDGMVAAERERVGAEAAWQPIETAPKDPLDCGEGPSIILCGGFTSDGAPAVRTGHWNHGRKSCWHDTQLGRCPMTPTHWMPLPTPPDTPEQTEGEAHRG